MWDTDDSGSGHLSHDLPCLRCGHAIHTFLACSDACSCKASAMPGAVPLVNA